MTEQKHYVHSRDDLMRFLDFAERQLYWLDELDLETRKRILRLEPEDQQDGWFYFCLREQQAFCWRESIVLLGSMTKTQLTSARASPLMRQTRAYARLEKLRLEICMRLDRHLRMMDRMMEEEGL